MNPAISIVTPSWNQGTYIADCIDSVIPTGDLRVEHIVVDNCSDDQTPDVLAKYPHLRVLCEKDSGQSDALNKGFEMARGEWILWLNADDFLLPGTLQKYIETVRGNASIDGVYGHMMFVDEEGEAIRTLYQPQWRFYMSHYGRYFMPSTGSLFRASLFKENKLDVDFHMIMDTEWMLRSGQDFKAKRLNRKSVAFRITDDNKTSENIRTGTITPQHAAERAILNKRYPFYGPPNSDMGIAGRLGLNFIRRAIGGRLLADKLVSRLKDLG